MAARYDDEHLRRFSAFRDATELAAPGEDDTTGIPASRLIAYARREGAVADFALERHLRTSAAARRIHDRALEMHALAHSDIAMAAAGGTQVSRVVGAHRLELIEEDAGVYLVIYLGAGASVPGAIEVRDTKGDGARLALGAAMGGIIQLRLDLAKPQPKALFDALVRPDSSVFLL
ncbi:MAG: hypothetical protein KKH72_10705 [Alphaproteobacteria bacterium]|nr:hypothetical protein [Alphaproteobacteria bacterium]